METQKGDKADDLTNGNWNPLLYTEGNELIEGSCGWSSTLTRWDWWGKQNRIKNQTKKKNKRNNDHINQKNYLNKQHNPHKCSCKPTNIWKSCFFYRLYIQMLNFVIIHALNILFCGHILKLWVFFKCKRCVRIQYFFSFSIFKKKSTNVQKHVKIFYSVKKNRIKSCLILLLLVQQSVGSFL